MLEFEVIQELEPSTEILEIIKNYTYKTKKGNLKHFNLQFIEPTEYIITSPISLTVLEYKVNDISNKPFYIKEHKQKYNFKEIKQILAKLRI